ncbi:LacI family DNA-binding transcriptional regulator [Azospirillum sp. YIM B02556]|uniref:LacI family DNA-binding transcriptional regulator n=1 Tax=Azospirillum endophyticum TaxID=2800326 RepID=A0ABS1F4U5_9PROT|nr:LacI family DNA-binding transcriptional regulator [Azospirillum endophyticum]MBK1838426.1 LacI family DNA-binding transcriptional regulator [Azospirillum endophyticum]
MSRNRPREEQANGQGDGVPGNGATAVRTAANGTAAAPASGARPTILDLAALCGVSPATVSNALADKPNVKAETRDLVRRKAREIGYHASSAARGLRMGRSWSIGLVVGDIANPFVPDVVRGVEDVVWRERKNLILCNTDFQAEKKTAYVRSLLDKQIDGMIVLSQILDAHDMERVAAAGIPLVTVNRRAPDFSTDYVGIDNQSGVRMAVDYLVSLGHRRIAFVKGLFRSSSADDRFAAFQAAVQAHGLDGDPSLAVQGDYSMESGDSAARSLMALSQRPTAILAANDLMALGALGALHDLGIRVPADVSVVGFDNIQLAEHPLLNLTTINHPKRETGDAAARLLLQRIAGDRTEPPRSVVLKPSLIVRGTTAPPQAVPKPRRRRPAAARGTAEGG